MAAEVPKRLRPTLTTIRHLFAHSGNECAFADCEHPLIDRYGNFVAQICHIEAAELGGERFNPEMTNEDRRSASNLLLMCLRHHVETNDVTRFPVGKMQEIKASHETRFADRKPDTNDETFVEAVREIAESSILDLTRQQVLQLPVTMRRWFQTLYEDDGNQLTLDDIAASIEVLLPTLETLRKLPVDTRGLLAVILDRGEDYREDLGVPAPEVELTTGWTYQELHPHVSMLERYRLLYRDEDFDQGFVWLATSGVDGWPFWRELKSFCARTDESLDSFLIELRFDLCD